MDDHQPHKHDIEATEPVDRQFVLLGGKPDRRRHADRYWDENGQLAEVVPDEVLIAVQTAMDAPPPPDLKKAKRLASLLRRAREG